MTGRGKRNGMEILQILMGFHTHAKDFCYHTDGSNKQNMRLITDQPATQYPFQNKKRENG